MPSWRLCRSLPPIPIGGGLQCRRSISKPNTTTAPGCPSIRRFSRNWTLDAAAYRAKSPKAELGLKYGPSERQVIDLFPSGAANAPLAMFIHGGYWRTQSLVELQPHGEHLNARGIDVAVAGYDLCPQVTLAAIIDADARRGAVLSVAQAQAARLGVRPFRRRTFDRLHGGDALEEARERRARRSGAGGYSISGLFDLSPMLQVSMNQELRLDDAQARAASPLFWDVPAGPHFRRRGRRHRVR